VYDDAWHDLTTAVRGLDTADRSLWGLAEQDRNALAAGDPPNGFSEQPGH
jgi:hypothetical protein